MGLFKRLKQNDRVFPLFCCQVTVAGTQGQAIGLANNGDHFNFDGDIEIVDHLLNDANLLGVLLTEETDVGLGHVEQLQYDGGDPLEVAGPGGAFHFLFEFLHADIRLEPGRIDLRLLRNENQIDSFTPAEREILFQRPRISAEILVRTELRRVDENSYDHVLAASTRPAESGRHDLRAVPPW